MKKGSKHSKETRDKLRISHIGKPAPNPFKKGNIPWNTGLKMDLKYKKKLSDIHKNLQSHEKHPLWKGEFASYGSMHSWVRRWKGTPDTCEKCGKTGLSGRFIQWANIDHKYRRVLDDYIRLCTKCHKLYDKENNKK